MNMDCREAQLWLTAYVDNELDLAGAVRLEQHLAACANCSRARDAIQQLRGAIKAHAINHPAPPYLRERIRAASHGEAVRKRPVPKRAWTWLNLGPALAGGVAFALALTLYWATPSKVDQLGLEIVASHTRSLMVDHLSDVASSDQHRVKPWFNGKLDFAPAVVDLATQGFALVGGRLDYVNGRPVAALVYRHRQHVINVFMWPASDQKANASAQLSRQGYNLVNWVDAGLVYWAVSDLNSTELSQMKALLEAMASVKNASSDPAMKH
jgi:anti-sigma factor (TIGR02949 family)